MSKQQIGVDPTPETGEEAVKRQLDAVANGKCDAVTFLSVMKERFRFEPDDNWEVLSLLDQYYRRGKIPLDVFQAIKNGFAEYILGPPDPIPASPSPQPRASVAPRTPAPSLAATAPPAAGPSPAPSRPNAAQSPELRIGDVLRGRYRIVAILAHGVSGTVLEASDAFRLNLPPDGTRLAVKLPRTPDPRGTSVEQLRHEFHRLQHLSHPNIVRAFDFDRDATFAFLTMELLNGLHLTQVLQSRGARPLSRPFALAIIKDIASALAYAHARGVVHGDVNPQNVFITMAGEVRLLGFGAAHKLSDATPTPELELTSAAPHTHRYASCEVFEGHTPVAQDDIYSLSSVAYLLLKGKHPYAEATSIEARATHLRPRRPVGLNHQQWRMLRAGLRTDARKRPEGVQEWMNAMALTDAAKRLPTTNELIDSTPERPRRFQFAAVASLIVALIAIGYWFSTHTDAPTLPPTLVSEPASEALPAAPSFTASAPAVTPPPAATPILPAPTQVTPAPPSAEKAAPAASTAGVPVSTPTRVELTVDTLDASPVDAAVHVTVRRRGNLRGVTSFTWWTESGTAKPGTDFLPVLPHIEHMQDGESSIVLTVPLITTVRTQSKGFYVGIESTDGGAQIGARALTQITLPPTN